LLEVVAQEGVERLAIGFDAIRPPIVAQQLTILFNERASLSISRSRYSVSAEVR
jgi:hypothetical protein